jgi:hypothetical protein
VVCAAWDQPFAELVAGCRRWPRLLVMTSSSPSSRDDVITPSSRDDVITPSPRDVSSPHLPMVTSLVAGCRRFEREENPPAGRAAHFHWVDLLALRQVWCPPAAPPPRPPSTCWRVLPSVLPLPALAGSHRRPTCRSRGGWGRNSSAGWRGRSARGSRPSGTRSCCSGPAARPPRCAARGASGRSSARSSPLTIPGAHLVAVTG